MLDPVMFDPVMFNPIVFNRDRMAQLFRIFALQTCPCRQLVLADQGILTILFREPLFTEP